MVSELIVGHVLEIPLEKLKSSDCDQRRDMAIAKQREVDDNKEFFADVREKLRAKRADDPDTVDYLVTVAEVHEEHARLAYVKLVVSCALK